MKAYYGTFYVFGRKETGKRESRHCSIVGEINPHCSLSYGFWLRFWEVQGYKGVTGTALISPSVSCWCDSVMGPHVPQTRQILTPEVAPQPRQQGRKTREVCQRQRESLDPTTVETLTLMRWFTWGQSELLLLTGLLESQVHISVYASTLLKELRV